MTDVKRDVVKVKEIHKYIVLIVLAIITFIIGVVLEPNPPRVRERPGGEDGRGAVTRSVRANRYGSRARTDPQPLVLAPWLGAREADVHLPPHHGAGRRRPGARPLGPPDPRALRVR